MEGGCKLEPVKFRIHLHFGRPENREKVLEILKDYSYEKDYHDHETILLHSAEELVGLMRKVPDIKLVFEALPGCWPFLTFYDGGWN